MPTRTIHQGFDTLLGRLIHTPSETSAVQSHRTSIKECLDRNFGLEAFFRSGSFGLGTSVYGHSDVDYFAVLPTRSLKSNSDASLGLVRDALARRFPTTGVYRDCPAIVVPFGAEGNRAHEIVIADYVGVKNGFRVFDIPDCSGGWMNSSPEAHNAYVRQVDSNLGNKVKPLVRFLKYWKYLHDVPISSFYLELRITKYASAEKNIIYEYDLRNVFKLLVDNELALMQDPMGISGYISPCDTSAKKNEALSKLNTAYIRANHAVEEGRRGNTEGAFEWLNKLFYGTFPAYSYYY